MLKQVESVGDFALGIAARLAEIANKRVDPCRSIRRQPRVPCLQGGGAVGQWHFRQNAQAIGFVSDAFRRHQRNLEELFADVAGVEVLPRASRLPEDRCTGGDPCRAAIEPAQGLRAMSGFIGADEVLADENLEPARISVEHRRLDAGVAVYPGDEQALDAERPQLVLQSVRVEGTEEALEKDSFAGSLP